MLTGFSALIWMTCPARFACETASKFSARRAPWPTHLRRPTGSAKSLPRKSLAQTLCAHHQNSFHPSKCAPKSTPARTPQPNRSPAARSSRAEDTISFPELLPDPELYGFTSRISNVRYNFSQRAGVRPVSIRTSALPVWPVPPLPVRRSAPPLAA